MEGTEPIAEKRGVRNSRRKRPITAKGGVRNGRNGPITEKGGAKHVGGGRGMIGHPLWQVAT